MRIQLRGDQPTAGDFVTVHGEMWKIIETVEGGKFSTQHRAVNQHGDRRVISLYHDQGYLCWTDRACPDCMYLDSHSEGCDRR